MSNNSYKSNHSLLNLLLAASLLIVVFTTTAMAQGSAFTYQGRLTDSVNPATGVYDIQFKLFDSADLVIGNQVGTTVSKFGVEVTNGVLAVELDFGAGVFDGSARFLEMSLRPAGSPDPFIPLSPRQPVTSTPYAVRSSSAAAADSAATATNAITATNSAQLGGIAAGQYVMTSDARLSDARPPTAGSTNYVQNTTSQQASANFNISGNGTAGGTLTGGVVNASTQYNLGGLRMLTASGPYNNGAIVLTASNTFLGESAGMNTTPSPTINVQSGKFNSFFGANAGKANTSGNFNSFFGTSAGEVNTIGNSNSFFGNFVGPVNTTGAGNSLFGELAGESNTTGNLNSFFGERAGRLNTTGNFNSFFGELAGQSNTTGSNNTMLGRFANVGSGNLTNATAIGAFARVDLSNSMVLGGSGVNVGIGTTAPVTRLEVVGDWTGEEGAVRITGNLPTIKFTGGALAGNHSWIMHLGSNGPGDLEFYRRVGPAAWSKVLALTAAGTVSLPMPAGGGGTQLCRNASFEISSCSSSLRYKERLAPFTNGLELINQLRPISFTWKQGGVRDVGLAAEEVEKVEPLFTTYNDKGEVEGVKYDRITVALVNAIKQLQEMIMNQQAQIAQNQAEIKRQQAQINTLKKMVCLDHPDADICKPNN